MVETFDGGYALAGRTQPVGAYGDFLLVKTDYVGVMQWNKTYGGTGFDWAASLVETPDGGYAIAGVWRNYDDTVGSFEPVFGGDFWLIKTDALGNMQWNKTYGETGNDEAYSLITTSDGGYALAGTWNQNGWANYGDFGLVKTDASGNMQWNRIYGGTGNDEAHSLIATLDGGYAMVGTCNYSSLSEGNGGDVWLVKTDANGIMEWNRTYGGTGNDIGAALVATSDGGYAITGTWNHTDDIYGLEFWLIKTDALGNMLWNKTYGDTTYGGTWGREEASSLVVTSDEGYAMAGYTTSFGVGGSDFWLIKTNPLGNVEWNQTYGDSAGQSASSLIATSDGGYALAGGSLVVKTDEFGVVPEYTSLLIPSLVLTATAVIIINKKRFSRSSA